MKARKLLPVGTRVRLISKGPYIWTVSRMKKHEHEDVFGIITEYREEDGERQGLYLYSRKTGEQLTLGTNIGTNWHFYRKEFVREKEPKQ